MAAWTTDYLLLKEEFIQRKDEGVVVPQALQTRFDALKADDGSGTNSEIGTVYDALMSLPCDGNLEAEEPDDLGAIRDLRPDGPRNFKWKPSRDELLDRLHGAWTGRCVGCALGKPVEGMGMSRDAEGRLDGRRKMKKYLENRGSWPLRDYFPLSDAGDGMTIGCHASCRENIKYMEPDDDIHYSLVGLGVLEEKGAGFKWDDVARYWLSHIPISAICTAEAQAILNFQNSSSRGKPPSKGAEWTSTYRNPYREWIGAQIRSDGWAFCCAGNPEFAAEFAWRDACWTHRRNGIYGEMMFAAMQSAAFCESDPMKLVRIGLSEIPRNCRLAKWVNKSLEWVRQYPDFESCMERLESELPGMHVVHTINNALICVIALFYGKMDTTLTPAMAVMCGLDTDCNGATVGSIVGAAAGRRNFGGILAEKLNDTIMPSMIGFQKVKMKELARRCAKVRRNICR